MDTVDIGKEFGENLINRDKQQGDGKAGAIEFRTRYLFALDNKGVWENDDQYIILNFQNVKRLGPSFSNEAFAYFTKYAKPERIRRKIKFINLDIVQESILDLELKNGYSAYR